LQSVHAGVIQGALGISPAIRSQIEDYLSKRGLIEIAAMGPELAITVRGIDYVEAALVEPDRPTEYFPPASTLVMHVHGGIHGSQIQQGTVHRVQTNMKAPFDIAALLGIVASVKAEAANVALDRRERDELDVDFATIELQGRSSNPKRAIIAESVGSIRNILEGAAGSMLAPHIDGWLIQLAQMV